MRNGQTQGFLLLLVSLSLCHGFAFSHFSQRQHSVQRFSIEKEEVYPFRNVSLPWSERVRDLVSRLTLPEIQEQMGRGGSGTHGGPAPAIPRLGIGPYQWDTECLRGDAMAPGNATAFPQSIGLAAMFSELFMLNVARATGVEVRGKHNDFVKRGIYSTHTGASCFSPVINIMRDSRWGRNQETYGEDPYLSGRYAAAYVSGLQGEDHRYVRATAGCKHFDAYAGPENIPSSRMSFDAKVSERDWRMTFLPAFRSCVEAGTFSLMCSYNSINGIPSCANKLLLTDILREEWNFKGYIVSDESAIENIIHDHHYLNDSVDTVAACINAGCNLELSPNLKTPVYFSMLEAVKQGKLSEDTVRQRVAPLFYTRMRLGEFDPPAMNPYSSLSLADVETSAHKQLAVEVAMRSFVLLKNNGLLPLKGKLRTIGVVGPFAKDKTQILGSYNPNPPRDAIVSALEGLQQIAATVKYTAGCANGTKCTQLYMDEVQQAVSGTDVNFVLIGTGPLIENEDRDRADLELPGMQKQLLMDVLSYAPKTPLVVLLFNAGPVNITFADSDDRVSAIMECFFPAQATGTALRHVLLNDVAGAVPAGRLPYTWPRYSSQLPPMTNYSMVGRTYRYFDGDPLYSFGYGLSYSTFQYSSLQIPAQIQAGDSLIGRIKLVNMGPYTADEVFQVYISWRNSSLPAPRRQLVSFARGMLDVGVETHMEFKVTARSMALWLDSGWQVPQGEMMLYAGGKQPVDRRKTTSNVLSQPFTIVGTKHLGRY